MLDCPGNFIHRYNEANNSQGCFIINDELVTYLNNMGINIEDKIGEGSSADVFKVKISNNDYKEISAALIIAGNTDEGFDSTEQLLVAIKYPDIFPLVYYYFNVDIPYSLDKDYLKISKDFGERTIQIIELMNMTLDQYIIEAVKVYKHDIWPIINSIVTIIEHHITKLCINGIYYTDLKLENIGVIYHENSAIIKLIDIEGVRLSNKYTFSPKEKVETLVIYQINPLTASELSKL